MGMTATNHPLVSVVLATHNRRDVLVETLARLGRCGLDRGAYEVIVVDNASIDGTPETIVDRVDLLVPLGRNVGSCAKAYGVDKAAGRYILFLDDDSSPRPGSLRRMIELFESDARLGAAGFSVHLPSGRKEGGALPGVFVGCGVGLRSDALVEVGGLDRTFFMQAEEYDLCFRLVSAGWRIDVFDDLHVDHLKTEDARRSDRTTFHDVRNNLRVVSRYLPAPYDTVYHEDWLQRYEWLAERNGHEHVFDSGVQAARRFRDWEPQRFRRWRLKNHALEHFFRWGKIHERMSRLHASGVKRVALVDLGKNIYAFHQAAERVGVTITAIGDDCFAASNRRYRGVPIMPMDDALQTQCDAVVVANTGPVHTAVTHERVVGRTNMPVHCWYAGWVGENAGGIRSPDPMGLSDDIEAQRACAAQA